MKMEPTVSSEMSAIRTQTPGNYPKRNKLQTTVYNQTFLVSHKCTVWAVMTMGQSSHFKTVICKKKFPNCWEAAFIMSGRGLILKLQPCLLSLVELFVAFKINQGHQLSLFIFRHNYLGDNDCSLVLKLSISISAWFHFFWLFSTGWVGFCPVTLITNQATFHTAFTLCHFNRYQRKCVIITIISLKLCWLITNVTCSYNILNFNCPNDIVWVFSFIHWSVMSAKHTTLSWPWSADTVSSKAVSFKSPQYLLA